MAQWMEIRCKKPGCNRMQCHVDLSVNNHITTRCGRCHSINDITVRTNEGVLKVEVRLVNGPAGDGKAV